MVQHRSKNPDLIFDDILLARAKAVPNLENLSGESVFDLDRVTLFVTHRCNLFCEYCNGPHMDKSMDQDRRRAMLGSDVSLDLYVQMLDDWVEHNLQHIHFTGGEATLNSNLPEFIKLASEHSVLSTLTTNGTADISFYRQLVDYGLSEIRISIDSAVAEEFDRLVGVEGACDKVKKNIESLVEMRDREEKNIFIILNACVGSFNVDHLKETIDFLVDLNPNDAKLLVVAEQGQGVHSKASRMIVDELLNYVHSKHEDYILLEKKICALFRRDTFGLHDPASQHEIDHCFIPLTERTLDSRGVYPCSIYLRYKADPLISTEADYSEQQAVLNEFVIGHDCRDDPICVDNCTSCCKGFNLEANRMIHNQISLRKGEARPVIEVKEVKDEEVRRVIAHYEKILNIDSCGESPFIVIKPMGIEYENEIKGYLSSQGVVIPGERLIRDWQTFSLYLYLKESDEERVRFKIARNRAYGRFEPSNQSRLLLLEDGVPEKKLLRMKGEFRKWYGEEFGFFSYEGERHRLRTNVIHTPNYRDLARENKVIKFFFG